MRGWAVPLLRVLTMNANETANELADRCESLCWQLFPNGRREGNEFLVGNVDGDVGRSLSVRLTGEKAGCWADFASGESGDLIGLVKAVHRMDTYEAIEWALNWLGMPDSTEVRPTTPTPRRSATCSQAANNTQQGIRIWRAAAPAGVIARTYLQARGITIEPPLSIRETPSLRHAPTGLDFPAVIAGGQGPDGKLCAVQRIFLTADFTRKAAVTNPKMSLGPTAGGSVRLGPAQAEIGIAEGIESGLAAQQLYGLPVWASLGASNLSNVVLPDKILRVTVFGDNGDAGRAAAKVAAETFSQQGREVRIAFPKGDVGDFNDLLQLRRAAA